MKTELDTVWPPGSTGVPCRTDGRRFYSTRHLTRAVMAVLAGWALYELVFPNCWRHRGISDEAGAHAWLSGTALDDIEHQQVDFGKAKEATDA